MADEHNAAGTTYEYLLGDSDAEAVRLESQAQLWDPYAHALFDRIGVAAGWSVLEVGPGQGSVHMERRRVQRPVDAVERSPWEWLMRSFDSVSARIGSTPPMNAIKTSRLWDSWFAAAGDPHAFVVAPTMVDVVGRK